MQVRHRFEKVSAIWISLPLYRPKSIRFSRWLVFTVDHEKMLKNRTLNTVYRRILWSLESLFHGRFPDSGPGGSDLCSFDKPRKGSVGDKRGPQIYMHRASRRLGLASLYLSLCCFMERQPSVLPMPARANGPLAMRYTNVEDNAGWMDQEYNVASFLAQQMKSQHLCPQT